MHPERLAGRLGLVLPGDRLLRLGLDFLVRLADLEDLWPQEFPERLVHLLGQSGLDYLVPPERLVGRLDLVLLVDR